MSFKESVKAVSLTFIFFAILGALAIASAIATITLKNPVGSAISLIFHFFTLAGLYLTLNAQFVAAIQILVYAGAIMVLVIFVIMLLNLGEEEKLKERFDFRKIVAVLLAAVMALQLIAVFLLGASEGKIASNAAAQSTAQSVGAKLFSAYLFPFEAVAILLLAAIIGAVVLAKRRIN